MLSIAQLNPVNCWTQTERQKNIFIIDRNQQINAQLWIDEDTEEIIEKIKYLEQLLNVDSDHSKQISLQGVALCAWKTGSDLKKATGQLLRFFCSL